MYTMNGKVDQKDTQLRQHAGLVKRLAYQLKAKLPPSVELDDLIQAGMKAFHVPRLNGRDLYIPSGLVSRHCRVSLFSVSAGFVTA